jgi:hypothetical protein
VADAVADDVIAVFTSAAPILRRGGHSQDWDPGGEAVGAFFGRWMLAIDYVRGFEGRAARATPLARYSAFVQDAISRYRSSPSLAAEHPEFRALVTAEAHRLEQDHALDWAAARQLLRDLRSTTSSVIETQPPRLAESRR